MRLWQSVLAAAGTNDALRTQLTQGSKKLLGSRHFKATSSGCCHGERIWVSRHASQFFAVPRATVPAIAGSAAATAPAAGQPSRRASTFDSRLFTVDRSATQSTSTSRQALATVRRAAGAARAFRQSAEGDGKARTVNPMYSGGK